ncbi:hypothetical protein NP493_962g00018 [Ridgeia piscesae]|uniref:peptidylprolyl isomerase n=1 Tax=Ridgeia piscesae TaxID=27915 RepID=A0AAD9NL92_RIDPI|nr:hypothetical protein NP493_962g00018 [Ridgeia piscesae]
MPPVRLKEGIDMDELKGDGSFFELQDFNPKDMPVEEYFDDADVYKYYSTDTQGEEDASDDSDTDSQLTPFAKLARKMKDITTDQDKGVLKDMLRQGTGNVLPSDAFVTVHYNAYLEYSDEPYDSTWLRSAPVRFSLGQGEVIAGLELAIASMKVGELSKFLVTPQYGYGKFGCPPRIPGNATLLFRIEMIKFVECGGVNQFYRMTHAQKKDAGFSLIKKVALKHRQDAKEHFEGGRYVRAAKAYETAVKCLEECHLQNSEEEVEQQKMLLHLYINSAICQLRLNHHVRVLSYCHQALDIQEQNVKAFFLKGKALRLMGEFSRARTFLCKAQRIAPNSSDITKELEKLAQDVKNFRAMEQDMCRKMFKHTVSSPPEGAVTDESRKYVGSEHAQTKTELTGCSDDFRNLVFENLQSFKDNKELMEMPMPSSGFTAEEAACICDLAKILGLCVRKRGEVN